MELFYHEDIDLNLISSQLCGCKCFSNCNNKSACSCLSQNGLSYDKYGRLHEFLNPVFECNSECTCLKSCPNRVVQKYLKSDAGFLYEIESHLPIGKGVKSLCNYAKGDLVCVYLGEVIPPNEVYRRERSQMLIYGRNYVLVVREYFKNELICQTCVDGLSSMDDFNKPIGRLINHSCSPNLEVVPVRVDNPIPYLALFANQTIMAGSELFYDYGQSIPDNHLHLSNTPCLCNSKKCRKYLPYVLT